MIRDIRPLQSADQNRLRDDTHRHEEPENFAQFLGSSAENDPNDTFSRSNNRNETSPPSLIKNDMWSEFFVRLNANNANSNDELFHWGELRENAKRHTQVARQSALLQDNTPLHLLNEEI